MIMKMCCNAYYVSFAFNAVVSFVLLLIAGIVFSESLINAEVVNFDTKLESSSSSRHVQKRYNPTVTNTAWFGPRLGRKKRSVPEMGYESYMKLLGSHPNVLAYYLNRENSKRSSHFGRKKRSISFGDDLTDASFERSFEYYLLQLLRSYPRVLDLFVSENLDDDQLVKARDGRGDAWPEEETKTVVRNPPFSPRLGRRSLIPLKPRLGRAGNSPEAAIFKPRLGRDPSMNEFSEYGEVQIRSVDDNKDH